MNEALRVHAFFGGAALDSEETLPCSRRLPVGSGPLALVDLLQAKVSAWLKQRDARQAPASAQWRRTILCPLHGVKHAARPPG